MKELSIKEKARAYDEAIRKAKITLDCCDSASIITEHTIYDIFPELKESEDERIRKGIKSVLEHYKESGEIVCPYPFVSIDEALAWLENQESYYTFEIKEGHWYKCVCDYMLNGSDLMFKNDKLYYCRKDWRLRGEIDERNVKDIGVNGYKSFFRPATNQEIKDWLEKQGKQKHIKNIVETWKEMRLEVYQQASGNRHEPNYSDDTTKMFSLNDIDEIIEKMSEQKPTDDVEPKFKVNEWVVTGINDVVQIKAVNNGHYTIDNGMEFNMPYVDRYWHKWTIQDAKDGDVLVLNDEVFIYAHRKQLYDIAVAHCFVNSGGGFYFDGEFGYIERGNSIHPATKEQRNLLFQKMEEAGYMWDAEKKEPKKIKQKSTDKAEPKFRIGDWVVIAAFENEDYHPVGKVIDIKFHCDKTGKVTVSYIIKGLDGKLIDDGIDSNISENQLRYWTIEDVKPGDVLYSPSYRLIWIYEDKDKYCAAVNIKNPNIVAFSRNIVIPSDVCPANKVQRNILFQKTKEAGYEWDADKKELKNIKQKSTDKDETKEDNRPVIERIKTFEDALEALGDEHPLVKEYWGVVNVDLDITQDLIAYLKLRIIVAALNEGWEPKFEKDEYRYFPWFYLYTKEQYDMFDDEKKGRCVLRSGNHANSYYGFMDVHASGEVSNSNAGSGSWLAFRTRELAEYVGRQFIEEWADFLFKTE